MDCPPIKQTLFLSAAVAFLPFAIAHADEEDLAARERRRLYFPDNTITFNTAGLILGGIEPELTSEHQSLLGENFGVYSLEYERVLMSHLSAWLAPQYINFTMSRGERVVTGYGGAIGLRYFLLGEAPRGPWVSAEFHAHTFGGDSGTTWGNTTLDSDTYGGGGMVGATLLLGNIFDVSLGVGAAVDDVTQIRTEPSGPGGHPRYTIQTETVDVALLLKLNVGFAF